MIHQKIFTGSVTIDYFMNREKKQMIKQKTSFTDGINHIYEREEKRERKKYS